MPLSSPPRPQRGRPKTKLASAEGERETLAILRRKLAAQIDQGAPVHALSDLVRQFRQIDQDIRRMDTAAAERGAEDAAGAAAI
jgi:hypothetical protein